MQVLTEAMLRVAALKGCSVYETEPDTYITDAARIYAREHGMEIRSLSSASMSMSPLDKSVGFVDYESGRTYTSKPEHMTHIRGNILAPKTHPRIALRGKLDSLEAEIISLQADAAECGMDSLIKDLEDLLSLTRNILAAEVKEEPLAPIMLWGMDADALRHASHDVRSSVGIDHPIPNYKMGKFAAKLNIVRTKVRETELSAAHAFGNEREDILTALNRMSSAVYLLFLKEVKRHG